MAAAKKPARIDVEQYKFTDCRDMRHHWEPYDAMMDDTAAMVYRVLKCAHCETKRHSVISAKKGPGYGKVLSNSYTYTKGYQVKGGLGQDNLALLRMHNVLAEVARHIET
jgi:hypothetical protein